MSAVIALSYAAMRWAKLALNAASAAFCAALGPSEPRTAPAASAACNCADKALMSARMAAVKASRWAAKFAVTSARLGTVVASGKKRPWTSMTPSSRSPLSPNMPLRVEPASDPLSIWAAKVKFKACASNSVLAAPDVDGRSAVTAKSVLVSRSCTAEGVEAESLPPPPHPNSKAAASPTAARRKYGFESRRLLTNTPTD
ncbi:MAG TPA: hypothetical protein VN663_08340 [Ramlibacter sp.]|nr:hypothetical protein [Ramlibacter sp.]